MLLCKKIKLEVSPEDAQALEFMQATRRHSDNILARYFARLGPHVADATRCADVFTATEYV